MYFISSQSSVDRTLAFSCFLPIPSIFSSLLFFLSFFLLIVSFLFPFSCFFPILSSFSSHSSHTEPHTKSFPFPQETLCSLTKWFCSPEKLCVYIKYISILFVFARKTFACFFATEHKKHWNIFYINGLCTLLFLFFYFLFLFFLFCSLYFFCSPFSVFPFLSRFSVSLLFLLNFFPFLVSCFYFLFSPFFSFLFFTCFLLCPFFFLVCVPSGNLILEIRNKKTV